MSLTCLCSPYRAALYKRAARASLACVALAHDGYNDTLTSAGCIRFFAPPSNVASCTPLWLPQKRVYVRATELSSSRTTAAPDTLEDAVLRASAAGARVQPLGRVLDAGGTYVDTLAAATARPRARAATAVLRV